LDLRKNKASAWRGAGREINDRCVQAERRWLKGLVRLGDRSRRGCVEQLGRELKAAGADVVIVVVVGVHGGGRQGLSRKQGRCRGCCCGRVEEIERGVRASGLVE